MDFYLVLNKIMEEKGLNVAEVARACNLTDSTVRSIIDRKQKRVALEVAFKLSQGLNVSLERLNGMVEPQQKNAPAQGESALTPKQQELFNLLLSLPPEKQQEAINYIRFLIGQSNQ